MYAICSIYGGIFGDYVIDLLLCSQIVMVWWKPSAWTTFRIVCWTLWETTAPTTLPPSAYCSREPSDCSLSCAPSVASGSTACTASSTRVQTTSRQPSPRPHRTWLTSPLWRCRRRSRRRRTTYRYLDSFVISSSSSLWYILRRRFVMYRGDFDRVERNGQLLAVVATILPQFRSSPVNQNLRLFVEFCHRRRASFCLVCLSLTDDVVVDLLTWISVKLLSLFVVVVCRWYFAFFSCLNPTPTSSSFLDVLTVPLSSTPVPSCLSLSFRFGGVAVIGVQSVDCFQSCERLIIKRIASSS